MPRAALGVSPCTSLTHRVVPHIVPDDILDPDTTASPAYPVPSPVMLAEATATGPSRLP